MTGPAQYVRICEGVHYYPNFVSEPDAALADVMSEVEFQQRRRFGRPTPRLEAWHGPHAYKFGGSTLPARALTPALFALKIRLECGFVPEATDLSGCLVNLYRTGSDSVGWHSDDEPEMGDPVVASISLGAERDFLLRRKNPTLVTASAMLPNSLSVKLAHGSLLVMYRGVQSTWLHSLPKRRRCTEPRVNLTYRG